MGNWITICVSDQVRTVTVVDEPGVGELPTVAVDDGVMKYTAPVAPCCGPNPLPLIVTSCPALPGLGGLKLVIVAGGLRVGDGVIVGVLVTVFVAVGGGLPVAVAVGTIPTVSK